MLAAGTLAAAQIAALLLAAALTAAQIVAAFSIGSGTIHLHVAWAQFNTGQALLIGAAHRH